MIVLAVSRSAQRGTSGMIEGLASCFAGLEDPRETSRCDHQLADILAIAVCAVVAFAESWEDIELYGRSKRAWLEAFLALPNGIPSHDTFRRVFMLIDPDAFEACFTRRAQALADGIEREVVAIDGQNVRRSGRRPTARPCGARAAAVTSTAHCTWSAPGRAGAVWRSASARSTASRTRSRPSPSCSAPCTSTAASSPWTRWAARRPSPSGSGPRAPTICWC